MRPDGDGRIIRASSANWSRGQPASGSGSVIPYVAPSSSSTLIFTYDVSNYISGPGSPAGFYVGGSSAMSDDGTNVICTTPFDMLTGIAPVDYYANSIALDAFVGPAWTWVYEDFQVSADYWCPTNVGHNKVLGFGMIGGDGSNRRMIFRAWRNGSAGDITIGFGTQNTQSGDTDYQTSFIIVPTTKYKLEYRCTANTAGTANGGVVFLVNDVVQVAVSNIQWTVGAENWGGWEYTPILGGSGPQKVPVAFTQAFKSAKIYKVAA